MNKQQVEQVNSEFMAKDESHLWPICGDFNVTSVAIGEVELLQRRGMVIDDIESYKAVVDDLISEIVNNRV